MNKFTTHRGLVVAMDRANVDTDQIIPKQFLKRIERTGYGPFLFFDWRYLDDGKTDDPAFELNKPAAKGASILLARRNFGCGSSREHAVWAIENYGLRVVIAPTFADIFYNNCSKNGVLPIRLSEEQVEQLFQRAASGTYQLNVDLEKCTITDDAGLAISFTFDPFRQYCMVNGLDDIALTLQNETKISEFEKKNGKVAV